MDASGGTYIVRMQPELCRRAAAAAAAATLHGTVAAQTLLDSAADDRGHDHFAVNKCH